MSAKSLMVHRCTIQRNTPGNTDGVLVDNWADLATGVRCLVQEKSGTVKPTPAGQGLEYDAVGFFLPGQDIRPRGVDDQRDRIVMTKPASPATVFLVKLVVDRSGFQNHLTAYLKRLPGSN